MKAEFTATKRELDGGVSSSTSTIENNKMTFEEEQSGGASDAFRQAELEEITSYDDIKPYIIYEDDWDVYCDFKGKAVHITIEATEENWPKYVEANAPKSLYIVGMLYNPAIESRALIVADLAIDEYGIIFGQDYQTANTYVVIEFDATKESRIIVVDRFVGPASDY